MEKTKTHPEDPRDSNITLDNALTSLERTLTHRLGRFDAAIKLKFYEQDQFKDDCCYDLTLREFAKPSDQILGFVRVRVENRISGEKKIYLNARIPYDHSKNTHLTGKIGENFPYIFTEKIMFTSLDPSYINETLDKIGSLSPMRRASLVAFGTITGFSVTCYALEQLIEQIIK